MSDLFLNVSLDPLFFVVFFLKGLRVYLFIVILITFICPRGSFNASGQKDENDDDDDDDDED